MDVLKQILGEIIAFAVIFAAVGFYAVYRAKKSERESENLRQNYDVNLQKFARRLGENLSEEAKFSDFLDTLAKRGKILKFSKTTSQNEFINAVKSQNFRAEFISQNFSDEPISQEFISLCVRNLNEPLALGFYLLDDEIYAFLCESSELYEIVDMAANLGENIIICD